MMTSRDKLPLVEVSLEHLSRGQGGIISSLQGPDDKVHRLMEMGLIEGAHLEVVHEAPFGKDPVAVRVRGGLLALRRAEAQWVKLRRETDR